MMCRKENMRDGKRGKGLRLDESRELYLDSGSESVTVYMASVDRG